jgi:hypothetical protein
MVTDENPNYSGGMPRPPEVIMARLFPMTWTALHVALAAAATWLLCETDALMGAAVLFGH